ncbi:MAG: retropepsin-like aspartic protease [Candidatus Shapirobacteria bacterium]
MLTLKKWLLLAFRRVTGATNHSFPFVYEKLSYFGKVFLPVVTIGLWFEDEKGFLDFQFIVDTGSTATILPSYLAKELGFDLSKLPEVKMAGVEGTGIKSWVATVKMRLNDWEFEAPCFFVDNPEVPFLLGRAGVLDSEFSLSIDSKRKNLTLKEIMS